MSIIVIIPQVENLTQNYHSNGGVVVVAESEDAALAMVIAEQARAYDGDGTVPQVTDQEWAARVVYPLAIPIEAAKWIFPDAGCC